MASRFLSRLSSAPIELFNRLRHRSSPSIAPHTDSQISQSSRSDVPMLPGAVNPDHSFMIEVSNENPPTETPATTETEFGTRLQEAVKLVFGLAFGVSVTIIIAVITNMRKLTRNHGEHVLFEASAGFALICFFAAVGLLVSVLAEVSGELAQRTQIGLMVVAVASLIASVVAVTMNAVI